MVIKFPCLINIDFRIAIAIKLSGSRLCFLLPLITSLFIQNFVMGGFKSHLTIWVHILPRADTLSELWKFKAGHITKQQITHDSGYII